MPSLKKDNILHLERRHTITGSATIAPSLSKVGVACQPRDNANGEAAELCVQLCCQFGEVRLAESAQFCCQQELGHDAMHRGANRVPFYHLGPHLPLNIGKGYTFWRPGVHGNHQPE